MWNKFGLKIQITGALPQFTCPCFNCLSYWPCRNRIRIRGCENKSRASPCPLLLDRGRMWQLWTLPNDNPLGVEETLKFLLRCKRRANFLLEEFGIIQWSSPSRAGALLQDWKMSCSRTAWENSSCCNCMDSAVLWYSSYCNSFWFLREALALLKFCGL